MTDLNTLAQAGYIASAALTGVPTAPTAAVATNTTQIATTAFVLANVPAGGSLTLLGTIATTSGTSVTLSGLTLTSYKQLQFVINNVSSNYGGRSDIALNGMYVGRVYVSASTDAVKGLGTIDLSTGVFGSINNIFWNGAYQPLGASAGGGPSGLTTASTSITFSLTAGSFDAGTITIYGVK